MHARVLRMRAVHCFWVSSVLAIESVTILLIPWRAALTGGGTWLSADFIAVSFNILAIKNRIVGRIVIHPEIKTNQITSWLLQFPYYTCFNCLRFLQLTAVYFFSLLLNKICCITITIIQCLKKKIRKWQVISKKTELIFSFFFQLALFLLFPIFYPFNMSCPS